MTILKKSCSLVALTIAFASAAQAGTHELGTLGSTPVAGNVLATSGSFADIFNFSVAAPDTLVSGAAMNVPMTFGTLTLYDIDDLTVTLFSGFDATGTSLLALTGDYSSHSDTLPVGNYSLRITGNAVGMLGGSYTYTAFAQTVPEPETCAMFIAGLGLIGFLGRRRKRP